MYIDTHTKNSMEKSICEYLRVTSDVLYGLFEYAGAEASQNEYLDGDKLNIVFNDFINSNIPKEPIDEILFFHLSRRLNAASNKSVGNNLFDLLSTKNAMTSFLKEHDVEFSACDGHLDLLYNLKSE